MKTPTRQRIVHGVLGGLLAGAVVAVWFFVVDLASGQPFATPETLAGVLLQRPDLEGGLRLVTLYTVLHFTVFAMLGAVAASILHVTDTEPGWLNGALFGVVVVTAVHYFSLWLTGGAEVITVLAPVHVVGANVCAGIAMMTFMHRAMRLPSPIDIVALASSPLLARGFVTGFIGAAAVALWFFVLDLVAGAPLRTPAALGSVVFLGASSPADVSVDLGIVGAYTLLHLLAFGIAGVGFLLLARQLERAPRAWLTLLQGFVVLETVSIPVLGLLGRAVLGPAAIWQITVANLLAVAAMAAWVWRTHPQLRSRLAESQLATGERQGMT